MSNLYEQMEDPKWVNCAKFLLDAGLIDGNEDDGPGELTEAGKDVFTMLQTIHLEGAPNPLVLLMRARNLVAGINETVETSFDEAAQEATETEDGDVNFGGVIIRITEI